MDTSTVFLWRACSKPQLIKDTQVSFIKASYFTLKVKDLPFGFQERLEQ